MAGPSEEQIRDALAHVTGSDEFAASPRLQEFLTYVVEESVAGRASAISGKSIAVDVYGRDAAEDDSGLNLVRVEARRLRRRLDAYYAAREPDGDVKIHIDKGGYAPRFDVQSPETRSGSSEPGAAPGKGPLAAIAIAIIALLAVVFFHGMESTPSADAPDPMAAERSAIGARSMVSLQAVNLSERARGLFFPVFDIKQQTLALEMFRHVIDLDPGLHHGYTGAAQVLGVLALLEPDAEKAGILRSEAAQMASEGLNRAPSNAWALAVTAWVHAVSGAPAEALEQARLAVRLAPDDGYVLDLVGVAAITSGDARLALAVSDPKRQRSGVSRFGTNNIWGVANYMAGNYPEAVNAFAGAAEAGASISAPSLVFLAVASDHAGDTHRADAAVKELRKSWPSFPLEFVVGRMFKNDLSYRDDILERIGKYDSITLSES